MLEIGGVEVEILRVTVISHSDECAADRRVSREHSHPSPNCKTQYTNTKFGMKIGIRCEEVVTPRVTPVAAECFGENNL